MIRYWIKPLSYDRREKVVEEIRPLASPGFDFFFLVFLSCSIATLGLMTNSPAVIIGAMLVAPLMSPIIGLGLASIIGDPLLFKNSLSALLRGAVLAVVLSAVVTLINGYLPILSLHDLPAEIVSRTHPSPIDLGIAMAGGLAAAYALTQPQLSAALPGVAIATALMPPLCTIGIGLALGRWDVAGGAFLLFITNTVTIAFAAVLVFFLRGFGISRVKGESRLPGSLLLSAGLTMVLFVPLNVFGVRFIQEATANRQIHAVVAEHIDRMAGVDLIDLTIRTQRDSTNLDITLRTNQQLRYDEVVELQESIVESLQRPVSIRVNQIFAEQLDPLIPPTQTLTPTPTFTQTPGPSPTWTFTPTATATTTPTQTPSPLPSTTPTQTSSPTATLEPQPASVVVTALPRLSLYQSPGGPVIGSLRAGQALTVLYGVQTAQGLVWVEVMDQEGRVGWVPEIFVRAVTPTFTRTAAPTHTPAASITLQP